MQRTLAEMLLSLRLLTEREKLEPGKATEEKYEVKRMNDEVGTGRAEN